MLLSIFDFLSVQNCDCLTQFFNCLFRITGFEIGKSNPIIAINYLNIERVYLNTNIEPFDCETVPLLDFIHTSKIVNCKLMQRINSYCSHIKINGRIRLNILIIFIFIFKSFLEWIETFNVPVVFILAI